MKLLLPWWLLLGNYDAHPLTMDSNIAIVYNTQTAGSGCARVPTTATVTIDMATAACNGMQCPRCFVFPSTPVNSRTMNLLNCHAVNVYPITTAGLYATSTLQLIEYTFLYLGTARNWFINDGISSMTLSSTAPKRVVVCYNGQLLWE